MRSIPSFAFRSRNLRSDRELLARPESPLPLPVASMSSGARALLPVTSMNPGGWALLPVTMVSPETHPLLPATTTSKLTPRLRFPSPRQPLAPVLPLTGRGCEFFDTSTVGREQAPRSSGILNSHRRLLCRNCAGLVRGLLKNLQPRRVMKLRHRPWLTPQDNRIGGRSACHSPLSGVETGRSAHPPELSCRPVHRSAVEQDEIDLPRVTFPHRLTNRTHRSVVPSTHRSSESWPAQLNRFDARIAGSVL